MLHSEAQPVTAPASLEEFENRLMKFHLNLNERGFGIVHDVFPGRVDHSLKTTLNLLEELGNQERIANRTLDSYSLLREILEKDVSLLGQDYHLLGLYRDLSGISKPMRREMGMQVAAQVLWHEEREKIPSIEAMSQRLLKRSDFFYNLLQLQGMKRRTIEDSIRPVFPVPPALRKQKIFIRHEYWEILEEIPHIWISSGLSFPRLRCALRWFAVILKRRGWGFQQILESGFVGRLKCNIHWYPLLYVEDWLREAYEGNGCFL